MMLDNLTVEQFFTDLRLADTVTIQEAALIWKRTEAAIRYHIKRGNVKFRKALSGGTYLITRQSLVERFGAPSDDILMNIWNAATGGD